MLYNIPIESLESRYSAQWNRWFPQAFEAHHVPFYTVYGTQLTHQITHGSFLDVTGTNHFKASQLQFLTKLVWDGSVQTGDKFFFHDLWFPGIEMLAYIRDGLGLDISIYGILHAGSYDPYDFLAKKGMGGWASHLERSWLEIVDKVFVATEFHRDLILAERGGGNPALADKIVVTGLPMQPEEFTSPTKAKRDLVVFPHRLDKEKNPDLFDGLAAAHRRSGWQFVKTKEVTSTKAEYYDLLSQAKIAVSFADQETWGIAQLEAVFCGCIPIVPDKLSYRELYPAMFRYTSLAHALDKVGLLLHSRQAFAEYYQAMQDLQGVLRGRVSHAILTMLQEMGCV